MQRLIASWRRRSALDARGRIPALDGLRAGETSSAEDVGDVQVAVARAGRTDADGFIGHADMKGLCVGL